MEKPWAVFQKKLLNKNLPLQAKSELMISFEEALERTLQEAQFFGQEEVPYLQSVGYVLSQDLPADLSMPPFDKSAMDGYACRRIDLGKELEVVEVVRAGIEPQKTIRAGQCAQIMTGAIIPSGADTVIMVEQTRLTEGGKIVFTGEKTASNICYLGEDVKEGEVVLKKGTLIGYRHIPVLATIGKVRVPVYKQPRIGVLATGTELVEPDQKPGISQIRNSNASQMQAQLLAMSIKPRYYGIAPDDEESTFIHLRTALEENDVLLLSGGVSMGEFDFVPGVLVRLGLELRYEKIAVQPGKPTTFAVGKGKFVFALPGNPVSSFVQFEILVKPFLWACMGHAQAAPEWQLPAGQAFSRKKTSRMSWIPVKLDSKGRVIPLDYHGSAHIFALSQADGFVYFKVGQARIEEGELVHVRPI